MESHHPAEHHWHLPLIGVEPAKRRRGNAAALLPHALDRIDREGQIAYLELTNPANTPLYRQHGFEVAGTIQIDEMPPVFPMIRQSR
jgi:predicted acetyltransferase